MLLVARAATTSRPGSALRNVPRSTCSRVDQLNTYDVLSPTTWCSPRLRSTSFVSRPSRSDRRGQRGRRAEQMSSDRPTRATSCSRPVVSEKSYGLLDENKYTFLVDPDANKTQIKQAVEKRLRGQGHRRQHDQPPGQAQAHPDRLRQAQGHQARHRDPCRGRPDRHLRRSGLLSRGRDRRGLETAHGYPQVQADDPGPSWLQRRRLRRDHADRRRRSRWSARCTRRAAVTTHGRITTRHQGGGHKRAYRVIDFRRSRQGRRAGQGRAHRVRPQPHRAHRAAALRRRREALHPLARPA